MYRGEAGYWFLQLDGTVERKTEGSGRTPFVLSVEDAKHEESRRMMPSDLEV